MNVSSQFNKDKQTSTEQSMTDIVRLDLLTEINEFSNHVQNKIERLDERMRFVNYKFETWVILSFFLFRFFDISKPFPINLVDNNIKNGFGVMFDDVIAGIFSTIILYLLFMWI